MDEPPSATITIKVDSLPGGAVGLGIYTASGGGLSKPAADTVAALLVTLQAFCDVNQFPVDVRRVSQ